ncbi:hypothetical protein AMTRI_Chr08g207850 [Amborella trichopoda]
MKSTTPRKSRFPLLFFFFAFLVIAALLYGEDFSCALFRSFTPIPSYQPLLSSQSATGIQSRKPTGSYSEADLRRKLGLLRVPFSFEEFSGDCDLFSGKWVFDNGSHPLYEEKSCPYIQPQLTCKEHGRPDSDYQHLRWKPHACSLPRFNATLMLERLRGKRMMYVGDSLNRGQFVSMVCLLHSIIPDDAKSFHANDSLTVFTAKDYNATIEFYWAPFLVESNSDNAIVHRITERMVRARSITKHAKHWKGVDILVFNTYLWWMTGTRMKILRGPFGGDMRHIVPMETEDAYRLALRSMAIWVEKNMDPHKTRVFFTSMSPAHEKSKDWGAETEGNCYNETTPIEDPTYWGRGSSKGIMRVLGQVLSGMKVPVTLLNITQLSEYRKDAHTSIYKKQWNPLTPEQLANPVSYADCVHWCLPGLQDTWNELLYAKLFFP